VLPFHTNGQTAFPVDVNIPERYGERTTGVSSKTMQTSQGLMTDTVHGLLDNKVPKMQDVRENTIPPG